MSSTVIPLNSHQASSTDEAKYHPSSVNEEEYRIAYMKLLKHKKSAEAPDDPDTLITCNSERHPSMFQWKLILILFYFTVTKKYHPDKKTKLKLSNSMN